MSGEKKAAPSRSGDQARCEGDFTPDFDEAQRKSELLDPETDQFTYQTIPEAPSKSNIVRTPKIFHGALEENFDALAAENAAGSGVFVTVNETNLKGRKAQDILRVRALFVDTDGAPLEPILASTRVPPPHVVVETSPGNYHVYWFVEGVALQDFQFHQSTLAEEFGTDPSVKDVSRVMRLPGFYHQKAEPFMVRMVLDHERLLEDAGMPPEVVRSLGLSRYRVFTG